MTGDVRPPRVLIVDNTISEIELLAGALEQEYDVAFALSGEQALSLAEKHPPDIVLLDVMMPGINGLETLRRMRAITHLQDVPVILVTGDVRPETQIDAFNLGAADFLTKPLELPVVKARTRNLVQRSRLMVEQRQLVASLQEANKEIERLLQFKELLLSAAGEGIFGVDLDMRCTYINPAALAMLGFEREEVIGNAPHGLFHHRNGDGASLEASESPLHKTLEDGIRREIDDQFIRKDGVVLSVNLTITAMLRGDKRIGAEVVFRDISERQRLERELLHLATIDGLTEVPNRRRFLQLAEAELHRVRRYGGTASLLMIDLDHFKQVNDQHGHAIGDRVLQHFARIARGRLRATDGIGRLGGEEFAVLLPDTPLDGGRNFAQQLCNQVASEPLLTGDAKIWLTASIGVTQIMDDDERLDDVLIRADKAMYEAKNGGRNRVAVFNAVRAGATSPASPADNVDPPVLDVAEALSRLNGEQSILLNALQIAPEQLAKDRHALNDAARKGSPAEMREAAHRLKSSLGLIGARRAYQACVRLESATKPGSGDAQLEAYRSLEHELDALQSKLDDLRMSPTAYLDA